MQENRKQISKHYQSERGEAYVAARQADPAHMGYAINFAHFEPHIKQDDHVLDFGCGNGGMIPHILKKTRHVQGVEVNPTARGIASEFGCPVHNGLEEIPEDTRYDVVVSNHVLEHVPNVCEVLTDIRKYIKPGGLFITKLPIDDIRSRHQRAWSGQDVDYHLQTWTPRLFANVLQESGYEVQSAQIVKNAWTPRLFPLVKWGLGPLSFWLLAVLKHRYQLLAVARNPEST